MYMCMYIYIYSFIIYNFAKIGYVIIASKVPKNYNRAYRIVQSIQPHTTHEYINIIRVYQASSTYNKILYNYDSDNDDDGSSYNNRKGL